MTSRFKIGDLVTVHGNAVPFQIAEITDSGGQYGLYLADANHTRYEPEDWCDLFVAFGDDEEINKLLAELSDDVKTPTLEKGCPKCGHAGIFKCMALCCPTHGAFGGL